MIGETYRNNSKAKSGGAPAFTLVELLLVMSLLVIVLAIAAPTLANFFRGRSLDNEARRLLAFTRYAQSRAVSEGIPMVLWFDEKGGVYGVEEETGYEDTRTNLVFTLDKDLKMEVVIVNRTPILRQNPSSSNSRLTATPNIVQPANPHRNFPSIRFLEDGTIGESSPELIRLRGRDDETVVVSQIRQHMSPTDLRPNVALRSLGFEIRTQTNQWDEAELYK
jgi:type II secretion system protein H